MNDQLLFDALTADERLAPDPNDVLAGVAGGIRRRRRRRLAGYAASVLALVVLAGAVAVTVTAGSREAEQTAAPADGFRRTLRFGWLPEGLTDPVYSASATGEGVLFPMTVSAYLRVDVYHPDFRPRLDLAGWQRTEVAGRPARLVSRPTRTLIDWQLPSGRWAGLEYGGGMPGLNAAQPDVQALAERVAAGVTEGAPEPVRVAFEATHLPSGMRVVGIVGATKDGHGVLEVAPGDRTVTGTALSTTEDGITVDGPRFDEAGRLVVSFSSGAYKPMSADTRVEDVGGKPAWSGGRAFAFDYPPYGHVVITGAPDDHRAVAEGVRWTG